MSDQIAVIESLSPEGRGVTRVEGKATFIDGALPGETVAWTRTRRRRHFDEGEVVEVIKASPERVSPLCDHFGHCGGCALQHMAPQAQIRAKQSVLLENLQRLGKVAPGRVLEPLQDQVWAYRRKARLSVRFVEKKGRALVGFREPNGRYVADLVHCRILDARIGPLLGRLADLVTDLDAARDIAQIEVCGGDEALALVFRHLKPLSEADQAALAGFGSEHGLTILLQPGGLDSVHALNGEPVRLSFAIDAGQLRLDFAPMDFIQVNAGLNEKMIAHALALIDPQPQERILDLFCGLGNFTLPLARRAGQVAGVEGDEGLVARARQNAANNALDIAFHVADLRENHSAASWARERWDTLVLDPPRSGAEALLDWLPLKKVQRVLYVSCHPASLARDAGILVSRHRFKLSAAGVMDMFPHTGHVESIALFER